MQLDDFLDIIRTYPCASTIGYTTLGEGIPMLSKGEGSGGVLVVGATHAREYITAFLLKALFDEYEGDCPIDMIPMLNIDGVRLAMCGLNALPLKMRERITLLRLNDGSTDFSLWKSNIRGVDLNANFDADWGGGEKNINYTSSENFIGKCPFSENESYAIKRVLERKNYALVVSYHSKGEEVYYGFKNNRKYRNEASRVADSLGYKLKLTPHSSGGLKDYFTLTTGRLGLTVEVGSDHLSHPIGLEHLSALKEKHKGILNLYAEIAKDLWKKYDT